MAYAAKLIASFDQLTRQDVPRVGGKNASLGEQVRNLSKRGVSVPPGFATTADAYWKFIEANNVKGAIGDALSEFAKR
jgi:pyruvate,water dikinase